ncbi:MAG: class I SAM-dependent rRNA methyltransferase [Pseudomonadota bacterium]
MARGHPWVYRDGMEATGSCGEPVLLVDANGRAVAFGLTDTDEIAVRVLGRHPQPIERLVAERVASAQAWREACVPPDTDACRLINGAGDGLPDLVVDRYAGLAVLRLYSAAWEPHLGALLDALRALPWVRWVARRLGVQRVDGEQGLTALHGGEPPASLVVREHGLRFLVRPAQGQKTGLFLDQRENRHRIAGWARGREVINLFGYSGGFSVHAAAAGAARTVTVDQAPDALDDARENFRLNGLDPDLQGFEQADAFRWRPPRQVGLVICDPPSLSRGARSDGAARTAYRELNSHVAGMVAHGGLLATASCTARLREERWLEEVKKGIGRVQGPWSLVHQAREPADHPVAAGHPEGHYLKLAVFLRAGSLAPIAPGSGYTPSTQGSAR